MSDNFRLAPPTIKVDELKAVPIDIQHLDADVIFDASTQIAQVEAKFSFLMKEVPGNPIFDLRQDIQRAFLNGSPIQPSEMSHQDLGGGKNAELRVIERTLTENKIHELSLSYQLKKPNAPGAIPIDWNVEKREVRSELLMTDLDCARYLESWFPSNLIFDQFSFSLTLKVINTDKIHYVITNGSLKRIEDNSWEIHFPEHFTSLSHLLVLMPDRKIIARRKTIILQPSGKKVNVNIYMLNKANIIEIQHAVENYLYENSIKIGEYTHGEKFTALITDRNGGMEYEGGTVTSSSFSTIRHEVFHSWHGRGVKPATQNDSWYDEAWTKYNTDDVSNPLPVNPFDMSDPPVCLSPRNPYERKTRRKVYSDGKRFFSGLAAVLGRHNLLSYMNSFYEENKGNLVTTEELQEYLICKSGIVELVDFFERFVYGIENTVVDRKPELYIVGNKSDYDFDLRFSNSPDLWVRNDDDNGKIHQSPKQGQDNWFYARVRNLGNGTATTFVVMFIVKSFVGTQFYPEDFAPPYVNVAIGFDLRSGCSMIVKAKWPAHLVPASDMPTSVLASVYTPTNSSAIGRYVWKHGNFAQKNLVSLKVNPDQLVKTPPICLGSPYQLEKDYFRLEIRRPPGKDELSVSLVNTTSIFNREFRDVIKPLYESIEKDSNGCLHGGFSPKDRKVDLKQKGIDEEITTIGEFNPFRGLFAETKLEFHPGASVGFPFVLSKRSQLMVRVEIKAPADISPGDLICVYLLQRDCNRQIVGAVTIHLHGQ